ncbi:DUF6790 family protein [Francisella orientalis]|uniref:Uncharacterized protein n=1 Tax=Francisella orientalis TaxID=299583 RepID=A0AAP6XA37_9GAMM|nr:DUF6790 family protein [Francisella orientalis]AFJ43730.1 hypothetical protein OOM_1317 [Francisella orientalis str. Toba 04]AHB98284.1 membrane protein [Francisella orientalis LADL 07-285A]AKN85435.1 hypothetical protein FNO12_0738 [Francisella orientalis FNO12]AKN86974.1 Hypothetical protein FNO24_0738 [Francisella orientalis FNO24]AKN88512.1 Hypothetical protein FNO190_0738 [Francisella orientalis]
MVTVIISICLLISPFIIAFLHSSIIYSKHHENIYANYFIVFNISPYACINSFTYLVDGDSISKFQGWIYTPAVFQIGIFELAIFLFSILALFKNREFKAACLIFFAIYTLLDALTLFSGQIYSQYIEAVFFINITTAIIAYILYKILSISFY